MFRFVECLCVAGLIGSCWTASLALAAPAEQDEHCDELDATSVSSPNGTWIAKAFGEVCDLGLSSSATVLVELIRAGSVNFRQVILGMDMQVANVQGVEIDIRFCPRDPAIQAKWLEYRVAYRQWLADTSAWIEMKKRDPASAVPKPTRPMPPSKGTSTTAPLFAAQRPRRQER